MEFTADISKYIDGWVELVKKHPIWCDVEVTADITKYIDAGVELAKKHPVCTALVAGFALIIIAVAVIPIIGARWLDFRGKWKKNKKPTEEQQTPAPHVVTVEITPPPLAEPPAPAPQKPVELLTKPPVDITKPLYREQLVEELCQEITSAAQAGADNKFLLSGFGGVGKTTVGRALYRKLKTQCKQIGWVECRESGDLKASLREAIYTSDENKTAEERFAEIERILGEATGQTILFLDNVDQPDELLTELTRYDITLVVTSRLSEAAGYICKPIPPLSEDECVELFRSYCSRTVKEQDEPVVRELVRLVSCHTLSVELLAKGVPAKVGFAEYLEQLKAKGFGFPGLKFRTGHDRENRTVVEHLKKLFDMAKLNGEQTRVMQNLALMADSRTLPAEVQDWIGCDENTLADLVRTGWLTQTGEGYEVHPIVREIVLLDEVPVAAVEKFLDFVAYKTYFENDENYRTVEFKSGIVDGVLDGIHPEIMRASPANFDSVERKRYYNFLNLYISAINKVIEMKTKIIKMNEKKIEMNMKMIERYEKEIEKNERVGKLLTQQGAEYEHLEKYELAMIQYLGAWKIYQQTFGSEHPYIQITRRNLRRIFPRTHYKGIRRIIYTIFPHAKRIDQDFDTWLSQQ